MRTTRWLFITGAATASLLAALASLWLPGTAFAADRAEAGASSTQLVARGAGYDQPAGAARVRALQRRLRTLGHDPGPIDGLYGPLTEAAVESFQLARGLQVDGVVGPLTRRELRQAPNMARGEGYGHRGGSQRVRALQQRLHRLGYEPGPIDGLYGRLTEAAVKRFQHAGELSADGVVGPRTRRTLARTEPGRGVPRQEVRDSADSTKPHAGGTPQVPSAEGSRRTVPVTPVAEREGDEASGPEPPLPLLVGVLALVLMATAFTLLAAPRTRRLFSCAPERRSHRFEPVEMTTTANSPSPSAQPTTGAPGDHVRAFGYASVPDSHSLEELSEQTAAILALCDERGWHLRGILRDVTQAELPGLHRPDLGHLLGHLAADEGSCLVVAQLGRLSSSAAELSRVLGWLKEQGIRLVAVDVQMDTATGAGRLAADALISVGAWERQRTGGSPEAPLAPRLKGRPNNRPAVHDLPALKQHIVDMRASGMTLQAIADRLNAERIPTLRGGQKWRPSSVQAAAGYHRPPQRPTARYGGFPYGGGRGGGS
jgi:peptidoglycan hydrolase-like protein with peptidoglycan-binding domain/DNA invertase Pin-like site-specific DNA recombinase